MQQLSGSPTVRAYRARVSLPVAIRSRLLAAAAALVGFAFATAAIAADQERSPLSLAAANPRVNESAADGIGAYARHLALLINDYRARKGLGPLELVPDLSAIASEHSTQMAQYGRLSHDGFFDRFDRTSARICVENVGMNFPHAEAQLDGWRASPGHHRNLLEPKIARMGIARSRAFVTFFACS